MEEEVGLRQVGGGGQVTKGGAPSIKGERLRVTGQDSLAYAPEAPGTPQAVVSAPHHN